MNPLSDGALVTEDPQQIIEEEYRSAKNAYQPTSRRQLAVHLAAKTGMPYKEAFIIVDRFCDEQSLAVPAYLGNEFGIFWLKVVAAFNILIAIGFVYYAREKHLANQRPWEIWLIATLFGGLAAWAWVKSLEGEAAAKKTRKG